MSQYIKVNESNIIENIASFADVKTAKEFGYIKSKWGNIGDTFTEEMLKDVPKPPPPEEVDADIAMISKIIADNASSLMEKVAKEHGYDSLLSAVSYATVKGPYKAEGTKFAEWRNNMWDFVYSIDHPEMKMADVAEYVKSVIESLPKFK